MPLVWGHFAPEGFRHTTRLYYSARCSPSPFCALHARQIAPEAESLPLCASGAADALQQSAGQSADLPFQFKFQQPGLQGGGVEAGAGLKGV